MLKQTQEKYKSIMLGFGTGSLYSFGCYLFSLTQGLLDHGYSFTPEGLNDILKKKNLWIGEFKNYIDVDNISIKYSEIFTSFKKVTQWPSSTQLNTWINGNFVVVCQVDARGIGGSGTHFVILKRMDGNVAIIGDPWFGTEDKVTLHYGSYGNILSLRVFEIKPKQGNQIMTELYTYLGTTNDSESKNKLKEHLGEVSGKCNWGQTGNEGGYLGSERKKVGELEQIITSLQTEVKSVTDKNIQLQKSVSELENEIVSLNTNNAQLQLSINDLTSKITTLNSNITQLELDLSQKQAELDKLLATTPDINNLTTHEVICELSKRLTKKFDL